MGGGWRLASTGLNQLVDFVACVHGAQIEELHDRPRLRQLRGVVWWRSELLKQFPSHTGSGLPLLYHWAVAKVALHEEDYLIVSSKDLIATNVIEPPLHHRFYSDLVLVSACASGRQRWGNSWDDRIGVCRDQVLGQLNKFGVQAPDIAELCSSKFGEVGLRDLVRDKM